MLPPESFIHGLSCWESKSFPKLLSYYQEGVKSFLFLQSVIKCACPTFLYYPKKRKNLLANVTDER